MEHTTVTLTREEVREAILSKRGEIERLAVRLRCSTSLISRVLQGKATSKRIYDACTGRAFRLLAQAGKSIEGAA